MFFIVWFLKGVRLLGVQHSQPVGVVIQASSGLHVSQQLSDSSKENPLVRYILFLLYCKFSELVYELNCARSVSGVQHSHPFGVVIHACPDSQGSGSQQSMFVRILSTKVTASNIFTLLLPVRSKRFLSVLASFSLFVKFATVIFSCCTIASAIFAPSEALEISEFTLRSTSFESFLVSNFFKASSNFCLNTLLLVFSSNLLILLIFS